MNGEKFRKKMRKIMKAATKNVQEEHESINLLMVAVNFIIEDAGEHETCLLEQVERMLGYMNQRAKRNVVKLKK